MAKTNPAVLRKIILAGTSDADIYGVEGGFEGLEYTIYKPTHEHEILNEGLKKDDQVWTRPEFPDFSTLSKKECQDLYIREIKRIKHGIYVWIGGILEYITGAHYFGLVHWKLRESSSDYLIYTETQRNIFYMFDLCAKDDKCAGAIIFSMKRIGKSEMAQIEMFADAMISDTGRYVVQALNDDEAIDIFNKTHYANESLNQSLPIWPHKVLKVDSPNKNLVGLKRESTKDSIVWKSADGIEGNNEVSFSVKPTKLSGIQGKKIKRAFMDEFASLKPVGEMSLGNYHSKAVAQVTEDFGATVIGKEWLIATAENVKSEALADAEEIWNGSDETKKNANGFTPSKLKRMFVPYFLGGRGEQFLDKFGRPKIEEAKQFYANNLEGLSEGKKVLYRRQNPETIHDVFNIVSNGGLEEDVIEILTEQKKILLNNKNEISKRPTLFYEKNGEIEFKPTPYSKDRVIVYEDPQPHVTYVMGLDGTGTDKETSDSTERSDFAFTVVKAFEGTDKINYTVVAEYSKQPDKVDDSYNAALYTARYFNKHGGMANGVLPETNMGGAAAIVSHFTNRNKRDLLKKTPNILGSDKGNKNKYGLYRDEHVKKMQIILLNKFVRMYGYNIPSVELIDDLLNVGKKNTDRADSFMMAICALGNFETKEKAKVVVKTHHRPTIVIENGRSKVVWKTTTVEQKEEKAVQEEEKPFHSTKTTAKFKFK